MKADIDQYLENLQADQAIEVATLKFGAVVIRRFETKGRPSYRLEVDGKAAELDAAQMRHLAIVLHALAGGQ